VHFFSLRRRQVGASDGHVLSIDAAIDSLIRNIKINKKSERMKWKVCAVHRKLIHFVRENKEPTTAE
jgi:hypothetical protein